MLTTEADFVDGVREALWACVVSGFAATFVSFLGGMGALKESPKILIAYTVCMVLVAVAQLLTSLMLIITSAGSRTGVQAIFDRARDGDVLLGYIAARIQMLFECCGSDGPAYWEVPGSQGLLPATCCHGGLVRHCDLSNTFTAGCTPRVEGFVGRYGISIGATGLAISITEGLGVWLSAALALRFRALARRMQNL
ncbi:tetraspanin-9-like isoform X2 [Frankliniella occidentalis]|nr:tetraspanin-9-like isoform X2 [Frankliniella occidentalis]